MIKETTLMDKCVGVAFSIVISLVCFAFAAIEADVFKGLYLLVFAVLAITTLPIIFLWPKCERVSGSRSNGILKLDVSRNERCPVFKMSLPLSLIVLCVYLFFWLYLGRCVAGTILIVGLIIALILGLKFVLGQKVGADGDRDKIDQFPSDEQKPTRVSETFEFQLLKRKRWVLCLVILGLIVRICVMCFLYGRPSFCPNCILYWGNHNYNASGGHLPEHSLFML